MQKWLTHIGPAALVAAFALGGAPKAAAAAVEPLAVEPPAVEASTLLYGGLTMAEVECLFDSTSAGCGREIADVVVSGGFCVVGLFGLGRLARARKIARQLEDLTDDIERAIQMRRLNRDIFTGFLSILAGDCYDLAWAIHDLIDCFAADEEDMVALPVRFFHSLSVPQAEATIT